jgi:hypothetical protein
MIFGFQIDVVPFNSNHMFNNEAIKLLLEIFRENKNTDSQADRRA